jgi:GABA(A) receptor-associated protein
MTNILSFKEQFYFYRRIEESTRVLRKYPDRVPVICEKNNKQIGLPNIDKNKYLVPLDITVGQFMYVIRKRLHLKPEEALFLLVNGFIPSSTQFICEIYYRYKDADGFLYIVYSKENTFG